MVVDLPAPLGPRKPTTPGGHLEVDAADGLDLAVVLGQAGDCDRHRRALPVAGGPRTGGHRGSLRVRSHCHPYRLPEVHSEPSPTAGPPRPARTWPGPRPPVVGGEDPVQATPGIGEDLVCQGHLGVAADLRNLDRRHRDLPDQLPQLDRVVTDAAGDHVPGCADLVRVRRYVGLALRGQRVPAAPALGRLGLDQRLVLELLQGGIDRPGAGPPHAAAALADLLDDLIAVPGLLGQQRERGGADIAPLDPRAAHELRAAEPHLRSRAPAGAPSAAPARAAGPGRARHPHPGAATVPVPPALVLVVLFPCFFVVHGRAPFALVPMALIALPGTIGFTSRHLNDISR